jgi:type I restriction enzyme S subunit
MRDEWKEYKLSELIQFVSEKIKASEVSCSKYISTNNMIDNFGGVVDAESLPSTLNFNAFKSTDTLFSNIRTYFKKVWFADFSGGCSPDVLVIRTKDKKILDPGFLYLLLTQEDFTEYTVRTAKGAKMPRGDKSAIMQYKVKIPSLLSVRSFFLVVRRI